MTVAFPVVQRLELVSAERLVVVPWVRPGETPASCVQQATPVSPSRPVSLSQRLRSLQVISACRRLWRTRMQNQEGKGSWVTKHALASSKARPLSNFAFYKFSLCLYSVHHSISQQAMSSYMPCARDQGSRKLQVPSRVWVWRVSKMERVKFSKTRIPCDPLSMLWMGIDVYTYTPSLGSSTKLRI